MRKICQRRKKENRTKDKKTGVPKKYLSGLTGSKRSARASLIKRMSAIYKSGGRIPRSMFRARVK